MFTVAADFLLPVGHSPTLDQTTENQLTELRDYIYTRGWTAREYVDEGVSGSTESRPALDQLLRDARRRRFDVLVCWRLDRLGRNLRHLILFLEELQALGVAFVSLGRHRQGVQESNEAALGSGEQIPDRL